MYLVYGASGAQGGAVAARLLEKGLHVRSITRNEEHAKQLEDRGIQAFVGDMADAVTLRKAHEGVDRIFLNIPVEFDTVKIDSYINHAIRAVVEADAELLVVNTGSYVPPNQPTDAFAIEIRRGLIERVKQSGLAWIAVEPIVYLENFLIPGVLNEGVLAYPVPTDQPISWISLDDAAQYHAYALTHPELAGNILAAPGKESLTGEELAQTFGSVLEQEIKFVSLPFDHFEAAISPLLGEQNAAGLEGLYQWISGHTAILPTYEEVAPDVKKDMELTSAEEWASQTLR